MKKLIPLLILLFYSTLNFAANLSSVKGSVVDKRTGEPLIGAVVVLKNKNGFSKSTGTELDGSFAFKNLPSGKFEIEVRYVSYKKSEINFELKEGGTSFFKIQMEDNSNDLQDVTIKAKIDKGSEQSARRLEQRSDQIINVVSARAIEVSPDITVANVTQRVSGVSLERSNNGEGQYPIIRGMEKRYTYTLIDGFKIPSPDIKNRYIPLDIFPSDIVERLEVYKSLTPSMEGDAIAGGINLVLKEAPDDFAVKFNLGAGLSQSVADRGFTEFGNNSKTLRSPRAINGNNYSATLGDFTNNGLHFNNSKLPVGTIGGLSIGGRTANKKFGALVSVSYQNIYKNTKGTFFQTSVDPVTNAPLVTDIQSRIYSTQQERTSAMAKLDYRFNNKNKINFDADFINLTQNQYRYTSDTSLTLGRSAIGVGRVTESPRSIHNVQKIYNFALHGDHHLADNLSVNWTGLYSKATANENRYQLNLVTGTVLQSDGSITQNPVTIDALKGQSQTFAYNTDQDKSGYFNFVYTPVIAGTKVEFTAGGMYRNKTRNSIYDNYVLPLPLTNSTQTFDGNIDNNVFTISGVQGTASDPLNYDFTENVGAAYGQFKFTTGKLQTIGGVRYENTDQSWTDALPATQAGKTGSIKYHDFLPSLNFKYMLTDKQNLRASYYSAISRPNFYELIPHTTGDADVDYPEIGNPYLKHTTADNYDLRYEFFPKALDQFLAGVFYKRIANPIEYSLFNSGTSYATQPGNFGTANNYGFELDATKYIRHFGIRANYAFTQSTITTSKQEDYKDATGNNTFRTVNQSRPLQGQSKHIGNLSLLYKDAKSGFDAQLSGVYTGERINNVSIYLNNDVWQKGFVTLDFSTEKRVFKNFYLYAKVTNLLNTPYKLFIKLPYPAVTKFGGSGQPVSYQTSGEDTFVRRDTYEQYYIFGLHYKL